MEKVKEKGGICPLMLSPFLHFHQVVLVFHLLEVGLQQQFQMLKKSLLERQRAQDSKYPLWKYITRHQGPGTKLNRGMNVLWTCSFCNNQFKSTYYQVKGHLLGTPCALGPCQGVNASKQRELEREANVGDGIMAVVSRKTNNEDPLPFLRKSSSNYPFGSGSAAQATKEANGSSGQDISSLHKRSKMRLILPLGFFSISTSSHLMLHGLLCLLRCVEL
jgi:hypothetical protein